MIVVIVDALIIGNSDIDELSDEEEMEPDIFVGDMEVPLNPVLMTINTIQTLNQGEANIGSWQIYAGVAAWIILPLGYSRG